MTWMNKAFGWLVLAIVAGLGITMVAFPASVTQLAGLAVAQSTTEWNLLKDMAQGDSQQTGVLLSAPCLFNGLSCDRQRGTIAGGAEVAVKSIATGTAPADGFANPANSIPTYSLNGGFNGTTWDRLRTSTADSLATTGLLATGSYLFNGATQDRARTASGDDLAATGIPAAGNVGFDGTTFDRLRSVSATNNTATTTQGVHYNATLSTWSVTHTPATATQATASRAAGGGTVRHVATSITACLGTGAVAQTSLLVHLRDGATGAGTVLRSWVFTEAIGSGSCIDLSGLNITGSANTAMTIETAAAPVVGTQATVSLTGYSTP